MHYPSPFHFVHSTSLQVAATYERHRLTLTHTDTHAHTLTAIPLALIFQQRHSIRRRPCHRLLPRDPDPRSARLVFTLQHHHQDVGGKHSADLEAELALCPPFPGAPPAPRPPAISPPSPPLPPLPSRGRSRRKGGRMDGRMPRQVRGRGRGNGNKMSRRERDTERGCVGGLWGAD